MLVVHLIYKFTQGPPFNFNALSSILTLLPLFSFYLNRTKFIWKEIIFARPYTCPGQYCLSLFYVRSWLVRKSLSRNTYRTLNPDFHTWYLVLVCVNIRVFVIVLPP